MFLFCLSFTLFVCRCSPPARPQDAAKKEPPVLGQAVGMCGKSRCVYVPAEGLLSALWTLMQRSIVRQALDGVIWSFFPGCKGLTCVQVLSQHLLPKHYSAYTHIHAHAHTHARMHARTHARTHTNTHTHTHARTQTHTHKHMCVLVTLQPSNPIHVVGAGRTCW